MTRDYPIVIGRGYEVLLSLLLSLCCIAESTAESMLSLLLSLLLHTTSNYTWSNSEARPRTLGRVSSSERCSSLFQSRYDGLEAWSWRQLSPGLWLAQAPPSLSFDRVTDNDIIWADNAIQLG
jgi:hypothetical protein